MPSKSSNQLLDITSTTNNVNEIELKNSINLINKSIKQNDNENLLNITSIDDYFDAHQSMSEYSNVDNIKTIEKFIDKNINIKIVNDQMIKSDFNKLNIDKKLSSDDNNDVNKNQKQLKSPKKSLLKMNDDKIDNDINKNVGIFYSFANAIKNVMRISTNTTINNSNVDDNYKKLNSIAINDNEPVASSTICHKPLVTSPINYSPSKKCVSSSTSSPLSMVLSPSPSSSSLVLSPSVCLSPKLKTTGSPLLAGKSMGLLLSKTNKRTRDENLIANNLSPVRDIINNIYNDKEISSPLYKQKKVWNIRARDPIARMKNLPVKSKSLELNNENYNNKIDKINKIDEINLKRTWNIRAREPIARMKNLTIKSKSLDHENYQKNNNKFIDNTDKSLSNMIETMSLKNNTFKHQINSNKIVDKIKTKNFKRIIDPMTSFD